MFETMANLQVPYILMHLKGTPQTMQNLANYTNLVSEVLSYFSEKITLLKQLGANQLIIDPRILVVFSIFKQVGVVATISEWALALALIEMLARNLS
jgi:dihydropteroate synthase